MPEQIIKLWQEAGFEIISCTEERFAIFKQWIHHNHYESAKVVIEKEFFYIAGQIFKYDNEEVTEDLRYIVTQLHIFGKMGVNDIEKLIPRGYEIVEVNNNE